MREWLMAQQAHLNAPYIDNSSILTVGFVIQIFAVVGLTWKIAQINTELQLRLHRLEYDLNNIADKLRSALDVQEKQKKVLNNLICTVNENHEDCDIEHL